MTGEERQDDQPHVIADIAIELVHVDTRRILAERVEDETAAPDWAQKSRGARNGNVTMKSFDSRHFTASLEMAIAKKDVYVAATVVGLYRVDLGEELNSDDEFGILTRFNTETKRRIADSTMNDLFPYIRTVVHEASVKVLPLQGILLKPHQGLDV